MGAWESAAARSGPVGNPAPVPSADLHVHASMRAEEAGAVAEALRRLHHQGLQRLWVYAHVVALDATDYEDRLARLPVPALRHYNGPGVDDSVEAATRFLASVSDGPEIDVVPQVDDLHGAVRERLDDALRAGVVAVKIVHDLDLVDQEQAMLESDHAALLGRLADDGVPAIVHLDLRRSEAWVRRVLADLPRLRLTIAHLGYSRARMGPILDEFENVVGDIANLAAHIEAKPDSYRAFLDRYAGRIVFGSDAFLGNLSAVEGHGRAVAGLGLSDHARDALLHSNWYPEDGR
jgi:hypothetical protein